ncbi:MAG TPA: aminotransferase [Rhodospirillales bacterium]
MTFLPNSPHARDIASQVHPQTNLKRHQEVGPTIMERGQGIYVFDEAGNRYIEGVAGLWCASLGFSVERLADVAYEQMMRLGYYHTYRHHATAGAIELAERLLSIAPVPMSKVLFQCSGSEANDTAIKLVWYYHNAVGRPEKTKIISRRFAYHGSTAAAVSLSGKPDMHRDFNLPFAPFRHADFPHYYRCREDGESEEAFAGRMADNLEKMILAEGPDTVAAFFAEPVMGAGGGIVPPRTYFEKVQKVLRKHDVLFVADEVICGFGRTGNMWGSETFALKPDMITCAKALSAAFQPISALLINEKVYAAMVAESEKLGNFAHGYTYAGHPVAAAVANEVLKIYAETDIVGHVRRVGPRLGERLTRFAGHPLIGDVSGVGLLWGLEIVEDKNTRKPFDPALKIGQAVGDLARRHGLIVRVIGDRLVFAPPLIIDEEQIDALADALGKALDDTWKDLRRAA